MEPARDIDERLADWVDGRLAPDQREALEREMAADPELAERALAYRATVELIRRSDPGERAPLDLADAVMAELPELPAGSAAGAGAPVEQDPASMTPPWIPSVLVAAALLTVGILLWKLPTASPAVEESARLRPATSAGSEGVRPVFEDDLAGVAEVELDGGESAVSGQAEKAEKAADTRAAGERREDGANEVEFGAIPQSKLVDRSGLVKRMLEQAEREEPIPDLSLTEPQIRRLQRTQPPAEGPPSEAERSNESWKFGKAKEGADDDLARANTRSAPGAERKAREGDAAPEPTMSGPTTPGRDVTLIAGSRLESEEQLGQPSSSVLIAQDSLEDPVAGTALGAPPTVQLGELRTVLGLPALPAEARERARAGYDAGVGTLVVVVTVPAAESTEGADEFFMGGSARTNAPEQDRIALDWVAPRRQDAAGAPIASLRWLNVAESTPAGAPAPQSAAPETKSGESAKPESAPADRAARRDTTSADEGKKVVEYRARRGMNVQPDTASVWPGDRVFSVEGDAAEQQRYFQWLRSQVEARQGSIEIRRVPEVELGLSWMDVPRSAETRASNELQALRYPISSAGAAGIAPGAVVLIIRERRG